jgi:hypothetical protein
MNIEIFERTALDERERCFIADVLAPGLACLGDRVRVTSATYEPCDVAVIMWAPRFDATDRARAARAVRNLHAQKLLIVETPVIRAAPPGGLRMGFEHVHRGGQFFQGEMPGDRVKAMGIELAPWKTVEGSVVIAGQLPNDYALNGIDIVEWVFDIAAHLARITARRLVFRPHPLDIETDWMRLFGAQDIEISREPLEHDLERASHWISYTSGSAVDAVIAGVASICFHPGNFAWDVSAHAFAGLENPWRGDRSQWLANLAYTQWQPDEILAGETWRHLRGLAQNASRFA